LQIGLILPVPRRAGVEIVVTSGVLAAGARFRPVESVPEKDRAGLRYVSFWGALVGPRKPFL
jgi:hypothetical protein